MSILSEETLKQCNCISATDFEAILSEELINKMTERLSNEEISKDAVGYGIGCLDAYTIVCKILREIAQDSPDPMTS